MGRAFATVAASMAVFLTVATVNMPASTPGLAGGEWQSLFSGDSLRGWVVDDASGKRVVAAGGILRLTEDAGWLRTETTTFGAFTLRFDVRAVTSDTRAMAAVLGVSPAKDRDGSAYVIPLFDGRVPDRKAFSKSRMMVLPLNAGGVASALHPAGDWQTYEVVRTDTRITTALNGAMILDQYGPRTLDGWIGFRAQRGPIELRNIQLGAVPAPSPRSVLKPGPGITLPRVLHEEKPSYTSEAMEHGIKGTVLIECVVEADGTVSQAVVVRSLDQQFGLDNEAVRASRRWRFAPATKDGQPVPILVTIELSFTLRK